MKTSSLFVLGVIVGALTVFVVRGAALPEAASDHPPAAGRAADPHEGHAMEVPAPASEPAPAPAPAPSDGEHAGHGAHGGAAPATAPAAADKKPENLICPVMGNEVDPDVYVDYKGRRIGFCCAGCDELFLGDPEKYLEKVDAEIAARKGSK